MARETKITVADRDRRTAKRVGKVLDGSGLFEEFSIYNCTNGYALSELIETSQSEYLLTELSLPNLDPYDQIFAFKSKFPWLKIIVVSKYDHRKFIKNMFLGGVDAYLLKNHLKEELSKAMISVYNDKPFMGKGVSIGPRRKRRIRAENRRDPFLLKHRLTKREREILNYINAGQSTCDIASKLFISEQTVSVHRKNILNKFGVTSTASLLSMAKEKSII